MYVHCGGKLRKGVRLRELKGVGGGDELFNAHKYRTEEEFKEALRNGALPWTEIQRYFEWRKSEIKDCRIEIRISSMDLMKMKALARMQGKKYQTYMTEVLKREIHAQEDRMANVVPKGQGG